MDQAEQLRNIIKQQSLQQNVQQNIQKDLKHTAKYMARVITVTSGKGGVGKSNVSVNLAIQLGRLGKKVIILDADFGLANVEVMLGIRPQYNLADLMLRGKSVKEIISLGPENIGFISGGSGMKEMTNLDKSQIQTIVNMMYELDSLADVIIIDTGAGISDSVIDLILASSEILLVATPEPTSITDAYALLKTLCRNPDFDASLADVKMIANRTQNYEEGRELFVKLNSVVERFLKMNMDYLGSIPFDQNLTRAVMKQQPVSIAFPKAASSKALMELALSLDNRERIEVKQDNKGISGLFSRMFRNHDH